MASYVAMLCRSVFTALFLLFSYCPWSEAAELSGKVVGVSDGDTLTLLVRRTQYKIRLAGIDAPEKTQPFGAVAKKGLSDITFGKTVRVEDSGRDRYGRVLGVVWVGNTNANLLMIQRGLAWHFVKYSKDLKLSDAELKARASRTGLWRDKNPVAPWEWRRRGAK